jgi:hypothetical protein
MAGHINIQSYNFPVYPVQPTYNEDCDVNVLYKTLPEKQGWETVANGPSSIKSLYSNIPNYYPYQMKSRPVGTMYGQDNSQFHQSGVAKGKRIGYHAKLYPLTNRHVTEVRDYADSLIPYVNDVQKTQVITDASLNSSLQYYPHARNTYHGKESL